MIPSEMGADHGWLCLQLRGTFAFSEVGIAAEMAGCLARSGVGILIVSTFDTDYLLIKEGQLPQAAEALRGCGHAVFP